MKFNLRIYLFYILVVFLFSCSLNRTIDFNVNYCIKPKNYSICFLNDSVCRISSQLSLANFISYGSYTKECNKILIDMSRITEYEKVSLITVDSPVSINTIIIPKNHYNKIIATIGIGYTGMDSVILPFRMNPLGYSIPNEIDSIRIKPLTGLSFTINLVDSLRGKTIQLYMPDDNFYTFRTNDKFAIRYNSLR